MTIRYLMPVRWQHKKTFGLFRGLITFGIAAVILDMASTKTGIQSGLAVAEALGNVRRPWNVENESGRIHLGHSTRPQTSEAA